MEIVLIMALTIVLGLAVPRWSLLWVVVGLAVAHSAWIVVTGQHTSEDSTATLLLLSTMFFYAPALAGALVGVIFGRHVRTRRGIASPNSRW
jgi:hypothetical protein